MSREEWEGMDLLGIAMCSTMRLRMGRAVRFNSRDPEVVRRTLLLAKALGAMAVCSMLSDDTVAL
jgi:hypothetical protein